MFEFFSQSEFDTAALGTAIGAALEPGVTLGLSGTLGAGKTRLTQAIGVALEIDRSDLVSPTFTLCVPHQGRLMLLHLDAYRINSPEEVDELGLDEQTESGAVLIVEWVERIQNLLPPLDLLIRIELIGAESRKFCFSAPTETGQKILDAIARDLKKA